MTAFAIQNKATGKFRGVVAQGGSKERRAALAEWRSAVRDGALVALGIGGSRELERPHFEETALVVEITFRLARPASHFGTGKNAGKLKPSAPPFPIGTPDADKLCRAVLDALKGTAYDDDSRVVEPHPRKVYANPEAGEPEGARIRIRAATLDVAPVLALVPSTITAHGGPGTLGESLGIATARIERARGDASLYPPTPPEVDSQDRRLERIRASTQGTLFEAERTAFPIGSHAVARHLPPQPDPDLVDTVRAGLQRAADEYAEQIGATPPTIRFVPGSLESTQAPGPVDYRALETLDSVIARGDRAELARRFLACDPRSPDHARLLAALATNAAAPQVDDDFGGPDL